MEYDAEYVEDRSLEIRKSGTINPSAAKNMATDVKFLVGYPEMRADADKTERLGSPNKDFLACVINALFEENDVPERYKNFRGRDLNELAGGLFKKAMMEEFLRETGVIKTDPKKDLKLGPIVPRIIALVEEKEEMCIHDILEEKGVEHIPTIPPSAKFSEARAEESDE